MAHHEGHGPGTLVLLHGFTGSAATWEPLLPALAERSRVVTLDLLGHGQSDAPADPALYSMEACTSQLLAAADQLGLARPDWLGYSLGGRVALALAARAPERVGRLILEGASPGLEDPKERELRAAQDEALARDLLEHGLERFADAWMEQPLFASQRRLPPEVRERARAERLAQRPEGLAASLRGLGVGRQPPLWDQLPRIATPTLLVTGALDLKFTELAQRMARAMPRARHLAAAGAGHAVHLEKPRDFLAAVQGFLSGPGA